MARFRKRATSPICLVNSYLYMFQCFDWDIKFGHVFSWPPVKFDDLVRKQHSRDRICIISIFWRDYGSLFRISKVHIHFNIIRFCNNYFGVNCWCSKNFIPTVCLSLVNFTYGFNSDSGVGSDIDAFLRAP